MTEDNAAAQLDGSCLCGAVSFTATGVQTHVHACHCSTCRNWSGAAALAASVEAITINGEDNVTRYRSSDWAERGFCSKCGSNLFYHLIDPDQYIVWSGTFDDQTPFKLTGEIYIDEKPQGYDFAGDHPRLTGAEFMASMGTPQGS